MNKISLCIITYNSSEYIAKCIQSALDSEVISEIIVVDNNSSDSTIEELNSIDFNNLKIIRNNENKGYPFAVNQAVGNSSQEIILLSNPDIIFTPKAIQTMKDQLLSENHIGLVGIRQSYFDGSPQHVFDMLPGLADAFFRLFLIDKFIAKIRRLSGYKDITLAGQYIDGAVHMFKRKTFDQVSGYDEGYFLYCEDVDFCYSLVRHGYKLHRVNDKYVYHARGGSSTKTNKKNLYYEQIAKSKLRYINKYHSNLYVKLYISCEKFLIYRSYFIYLILEKILGIASFKEKKNRMVSILNGIEKTQNKYEKDSSF